MTWRLYLKACVLSGVLMMLFYASRLSAQGSGGRVAGRAAVELPESVSDYTRISEEQKGNGRIQALYRRPGGSIAEVLLDSSIVMSSDTVEQKQTLRSQVSAAMKRFSANESDALPLMPDSGTAENFRLTGPTGHRIFGARSRSNGHSIGRECVDVYVVSTNAGLLQVRARYVVRPDSEVVRKAGRSFASGLAVALDLQR